MSLRVLAIIALGSNIGDSHAILLQAMERLESLSSKPLLRSSMWRTSPVDCPPGSPPFVNAVVGLTPRGDETPESLLEKLLVLEKEFGRKPKVVVNEPRRLDLDWRLWPYAKSKGVKCVINPDAHRNEHSGFLRFGTGIAAKGWLERQDVVNTSSLKVLLKQLALKRSKRCRA